TRRLRATDPAPPAQTTAPAAVAPPAQARDAREVIRRDGQGPQRGIAAVRKERHETREGNRAVIREQDRTIIREGNRTIIRHDEGGRFAVGARNVQTERGGANTETVIVRPNGVRIVNITDRDGHLVRRVRRDANGRDFVLINNGLAAGVAAGLFLSLAAPGVLMRPER